MNVAETMSAIDSRLGITKTGEVQRMFGPEKRNGESQMKRRLESPMLTRPRECPKLCMVNCQLD